MKKSVFTLSAIALMAFGISSCQKEEAAQIQIPQHFRACTESSAKTTLNSALCPVWEDDDQIRLGFQSGTDGVIYNAAPDQNDPTWADFSHEGTSVIGTPLYAIFPASIAQGQPGNQVLLPEVQTSTNGSFSDVPMVADFSDIVPTDGMRVKFKNLCSVLKIHAQANTSISEIAVITDQQINGRFTVSFTDGEPVLTPVCVTTVPYTSSRITTLVLSEAQDISTGKDFYIYVPAGDYSNVKLRFKNADGNYCTKTSNTLIVNPNEIKPISLGSMVFSAPAQLRHETIRCSSKYSITFHYHSNVTSSTNIAEEGSTPIYLVSDESTALHVHTSASVILAPQEVSYPWGSEVYGGCSDLFRGQSSLRTIDFGDGFITDHVSKMQEMFYGCNRLTSIDLSTFKCNGPVDMQGTFGTCLYLTSIVFNHDFTASRLDDAFTDVSRYPRQFTIYCNQALANMIGTVNYATFVTEY